MKSILIIGSSSVIGRYLGDFLSNSYNVVYAGRKNCDIYLNLLHKEINIHEFVKFNFDTIIYCCAHFGEEGYSCQYEAEQVNACGVILLSEIAKQTQAKQVIYLSTVSIYRSLASSASPDSSFYSLSKWHGEQLLDFFKKKYHLPVLCLRLTAIYDSAAKCIKSQPFLYTLIDRVSKGNEIILYGTKDPYRNYMHIRDLCEIISKSIDYKLKGTYDCVSPEFLKVTQIIEVISKVFCKKANWIFDPLKTDIKEYPINHCEKRLYKLIDFIPKVSFKQGIARVLENNMTYILPEDKPTYNLKSLN